MASQTFDCSNGDGVGGLTATPTASKPRERKPPAVRVKNVGGHSTTIEALGNDDVGWHARLNEAFGSISDEFTLQQLRYLVDVSARDGLSAQNCINGLLAAVDGVNPTNSAEGMLAVQMAVTHALAMTFMKRLASAANTTQQQTDGALATKMLRTFTVQLEALGRFRRGGEQRVTVEHVHVHAGGQAIVGSVAHPGGGDERNKRQPRRSRRRSER